MYKSIANALVLMAPVFVEAAGPPADPQIYSLVGASKNQVVMLSNWPEGKVFSVFEDPRKSTSKVFSAGQTVGLVEVNFEVSALRSESKNDLNTFLEPLLAHIDYLVDRMGIDSVGFGSDFDGATMPHMLPDVAALSTLVAKLKERYGRSEVKKLCSENWIRVIRAT